MHFKLATQTFLNSVTKAISFCDNRNIIDGFNWKEGGTK